MVIKRNRAKEVDIISNHSIYCELFRRLINEMKLKLICEKFQMATWLIILANNIECFYVAWTIIGLAAGAAGVSIPIFVAEISSNK